MKLYTISDAALAAERQLSDLAWRGIIMLPCTQQPPRQDVPALPDQGYWGHQTQTELEAIIHHD